MAQPAATQEQITELVQMMRDNGVDAWDLGFQGQLSPGAYEQGLQIYLERFGYEQTKKNIVSFLRKRPRK